MTPSAQRSVPPAVRRAHLVPNNAPRAAVLGAVVFLFAIAAFSRNSVYVTKLDLWTDVAAKTPGKSRVHNSLGNCYMLLGNHFKAVEEYRIALSLDRSNFEAYFNMAVNLEKIGLVAEAFQYYALFCRMKVPDYPDAVAIACDRAAFLSREHKLAWPGK